MHRQHSPWRVSTRRRRLKGYTLVEVVVAMLLSTMLAAGVGVLMVTGTRTWHRTYNWAYKDNRQAAQTVLITFSNIARKTNRSDYVLYTELRGLYIPVLAADDDTDIVVGDAVEFRYWDQPFDTADSANLMDRDKKSTAYAFFYIDSGALKVDYGSVPPGAVPLGGGARNTTNISTRILAENVTADPDSGPFSHTTVGNVGQGCVRINIAIADPDDEDNTVTVKTATLTRNIWPR